MMLPCRLLRFLLVPPIVLAMVFGLYWPGVMGGVFVFDDIPNLSILAEFGQVNTWQEWLAFLRSGIAGPTGRPLSLLSFLLDGNTWPIHPRPFLRTNVLIHGMNGCLVFLCTYLLLRPIPSLYAHRYRAAWLSGLLWTLHPYWVSTVLYVVQRMAMLSAFFVLLGIAVFLYGRALTLREDTRKRGWKLVWAAWAGAGSCAVLAKENGALLPVLLLVLEQTVIASLWPKSLRDVKDRAWQGWKTIGLYVPFVAILGYLSSRAFAYGLHERGERVFTLYERLLTEPRIILGYLYDLLIPKPGYPGLFYDNYPFSRGLIDPPHTLAAWMTVLALIAGALFLRQKYSFLSCAVLFFFAGHLLESTVLPLELAFEHRNYLPAVFLFLPLAVCISQKPHIMRVALLGVALEALFTFQLTTLWGRPVDLALYWVMKNPDSYRAAVVAASRLQEAGFNDLAKDVLTQALSRHPDSMALNLALLNLEHFNASVTGEDFDRALTAIRQGPYDPHAVDMVESFVDEFFYRGNQALAAGQIDQLLDVFAQRPEYAARKVHRTFLQFEKGRMALARADIDQACRYFESVSKESARVGTDLKLMSTLAEKEYFAEAKQFLDVAIGRFASGNRVDLKFPSDWYEAEFRRLERELQEQLQRRSDPTGACQPSL